MVYLTHLQRCRRGHLKLLRLVLVADTACLLSERRHQLRGYHWKWLLDSRSHGVSSLIDYSIFWLR